MGAFFFLDLSHAPSYAKIVVILNNTVILTLVEYNAGGGTKSL